MDNPSPVDRGVLLPILLGGFSIVGIIVVLLIGRSLNSPPPVPTTPSATQFQYIYLGTEPAITTPLTEESVIPVPTEPPVEGPIEATPTFLSPTSALTSTSPTVATLIILTKPNTTSTSTSIVLRTNTPTQLSIATATATLGTTTPTAADTYDDTDTRLAYSGSWTSQNGLTGPYQGTLHISNIAGSNSVSFTFTGQQVHFFYQAGSSNGIVGIRLDNDSLVNTVSEVQGGEWVSTLLTPGLHTVTITHVSGGSVNIDRLVIPAPTLTPTRTPTPTITPSQ